MGQGAVQREQDEASGRPRSAGSPAAPRVHHHGIRGSAALTTRPLTLGAVAAESLEPGEMRRVAFAGELLGAARVRSGFVPIPLDAFDEAAPALAPEAQAAYFHLLRLSYGEGRNYCRAAKRELMGRLPISERRLLRVLDALAARGLLRPLHRDNRGTLWRVYLPREAAGQKVGDEVLLGRAAAALPRSEPAPASAAPPPPRPDPVAHGARDRPLAVSARQPAPGASGPDLVNLSRALAAARGDAGEAALERATQEVCELLAEGQAPARVAAAIETIRRRTAREADSVGGPK